MARQYASRGVQSVFIYVREAHPGEIYPHHDSFVRKLAHAREFRRLFGIERPILVDDLQGTAHEAFGRMPNMTYVLNAGHRVVFRSDWTDPPMLRFALEYLLDVQSRRREGARLAPFYAEVQGFRWIDRAGFDAGLARNGPKALAEYHAAQERWDRGEHIGSLPSRRDPPV
jgi:hypothetical protein